MSWNSFWFHLVHVNWLSYIHLNFFTKSVHSQGGRIVPLWRSCIRISRKANVTIGKKNCLVGTFIRPHQKQYAYLTCGDDAQVVFSNGFTLQRGSRLEIEDKATFKAGFFCTNENTLIRCFSEISIGEHVFFSHGVSVFDGDGHSIVQNGQTINPPRPIHIGNNVWINRNVSIGKGVSIGDDSVIAAEAVITKDVPSHCVVGSSFSPKIIKSDIFWQD